MTRDTRARVRPGISLIEILVVISIIAVLLALTAAGLQKTVEGQNIKSSETQVFKLQQALDQEYDRVVQKCDADSRNGGIPPPLVDYADGNMARARAIWTTLNLYQHFPQTFTEGQLALNVHSGSPPTAANLIYSLKPKSVFLTDLSGLTVPTGGAHEESGVLLFLILSKQSTGGSAAMGASSDDLNQAMKRKVACGTREMETFADAWKNTVGFRRWDQSDEIQVAPYTDGRGANKDPLDPQNLVLGWSETGRPDRAAVKAFLGFNGRNRMATVYSVNKDRANPADDILGFRLRKQGERGFKP